MHEFKSWDNKTIIKLLSCPFCGGKPELHYNGNEYTNQRSIEIKCIQCGCMKKDSGYLRGFHWLEDLVTKNWNQRSNISCLVELFRCRTGWCRNRLDILFGTKGRKQ